MNRAIRKPSRRFGQPEIRAFTLIELLVAITAGLFVSIAAVALARQGSKFFQQEARIATAQFGATLGFDRMRADIARAGFMSSPNIQRDRLICGAPDALWPEGMKRLAAIRIEQAEPAEAKNTTNNLAPDRITLSGSYASVEWFPVRRVVSIGNGNTFNIFLQVANGSVARSGGANALDAIFKAGRMLRVLDSGGRYEYGAIQSFTVDAAGTPVITLAQRPAITFSGSTTTCGVSGDGTGMMANVVNIIRYEIRDVQHHSQGGYAPLYAGTAQAPGDENRLELIRVELDIDGNEIDGTLEIVAEYAVDLKFGLTVVSNSYGANGLDPSLTVYDLGSGDVRDYAGDVTQPTSATKGPEKIRSVRARMSVRSREGDRRSSIDTDGGVLFRYAMPDGISFARMRTVTADIALPNLAGVAW
jgi:hypothetical protein